MTMKHIGDIASSRLSQEQLSCQFSDVAPLLNATAALQHRAVATTATTHRASTHAPQK
jgi:hypothetical protein